MGPPLALIGEFDDDQLTMVVSRRTAISQIAVATVLAARGGVAGSSHSHVENTIEATQSHLVRKRPPGFPEIPLMPKVVVKPGRVETTGLLDAFLERYPGVRKSPIAYVSQIGDDSAGRLNDKKYPFRSPEFALKYTPARIVHVLDGDYNPPDYRRTDAGGPKLLIPDFGAKPTFRVLAGDNIAEGWRKVPGRAGLYARPIQSHASGQTGEVNRILLFGANDRDAFGFPGRLRKVNRRSELLASGQGFFYDSATYTCFAMRNGSDLSLKANSADMRALYYDANGNARLFVYGATLMVSGFQMIGVQCIALEFGPTSAELWLANNRVLYAAGGHANQASGSALYSQNNRIHAPLADGHHSDWGSNGNEAILLTAGDFVTDCGDVQTQGLVQPSCQGSSSHSGFYANFGTRYESNWGQELADTSADPKSGIPCLSWLVGAIATNGDHRLAADRVGFGFYGNGVRGDTSNRKAWLDTCAVSAEGSAALHVEGYASAKVFECAFEAPPEAKGGSKTPAMYQPENPGE